MTNNLLYLQVTVWIHDHGLQAEDPTVTYLEDWARSFHAASGSVLTDGSWDGWPMNFEAVEKAMSMELSKAHVSFVYPPHAPSTHPQSWATASEITIEAKHLAYNLAQIINGTSTKEEREETPSKAGGPSSVNN
jgi:hypothetical protein